MEIAERALSPLASRPQRARCATQAAERHLHMARSIRTRAAAWAAGETPVAAQALDLARQLYEEIERPVDCEHRPRGTTSLLARLEGDLP